MNNHQFRLFDIINEFLEKTKMQWNHGDWLELLSRVEKAGFKVDPDELGLMIERERERRMN